MKNLKTKQVRIAIISTIIILILLSISILIAFNNKNEPITSVQIDSLQASEPKGGLHLGLLLYRDEDENGDRHRICNRWADRNNR